MLQLHAFRSSEMEQSLYKNIPIQHLAEVQARLKVERPGARLSYRFRGPRGCAGDHRSRGRRMQDAVKMFANRFSVYVRNL